MEPDDGLAHWIDEAARLICDEGYADYRMARAKAGERLGRGRGDRAPEPARIEAAVIRRQQLFGGETYRHDLHRMRQTALQAMRLLDTFAPRLAGSAVSGAIGVGHRVQMHVVADQPERVEMFLLDRQIPFEQGERRYRLANGREADIPLLSFEAAEMGIDIAVFSPDSERHPPLSQIDQRPARRLTAGQVRALLDAEAGA